MTEPNADRYAVAELEGFAAACLRGAGLDAAIASVVARYVVAADLHGRDTHGLALLPRYLADLIEGRTASSGEPRVLADHGACLLWDGGMLPGHFVMDRAVATAVERADEHGMAGVAVRRSQHAGALQVYLETATRRGMLCMAFATDPAVRSVAPFGGVEPVLTSEPLAAGIPTGGAPILIDMATSLASNAMAKRYRTQGARLPAPLLLDAEGRASDDPVVLETDPPSTILPLGGPEQGHKGYALALLVSALALALPGWGRVEGDKNQGLFVQVIDPARFAGSERFLREMDWLAAACRSSRVPENAPPVRLPGEAALERRAQALAEGFRLAPATREALAPWSERLAVAWPAALPA